MPKDPSFAIPIESLDFQSIYRELHSRVPYTIVEETTLEQTLHDVLSVDSFTGLSLKQCRKWTMIDSSTLKDTFFPIFIELGLFIPVENHPLCSYTLAPLAPLAPVYETFKGCSSIGVDSALVDSALEG